MSLTAATHGNGRVPSSIIIITQSDTVKIEYVNVWSKKISLEQLLFE